MSGEVVFRKFFGPPGYGEDPEEDKLETAIILILSAPINIEGNPNDALNSKTQKNVEELQLVISSEKMEGQILSGEIVTVKGYLFTGHTGHHKTKVLMIVKEIIWQN